MFEVYKIEQFFPMFKTGVAVETGKKVTDRQTIEDVDIEPIVIEINAGELGSEHNPRNLMYIIFLWIVSIYAMVTNVIQAILIKLFKNPDHSMEKILWNLGRSDKHISSLFVDRISKYNHMSKYFATKWQSLDIFYNYFKKIEPKLKKNLEGLATRLWIEKMENRQAVSNRKKIVTNLLVKSFFKLAVENDEIRVVSVASGSAQAVLEAMEECRGLNIEAVFVDIEKGALEKAEELSEKYGLNGKVTFIRGTPKKLEEICSKFRPHLIEMVGFLDYQEYNRAVKLINQVYKCLEDGGIYITCNINYNREKIFLDWVLLWPMVYRNKDEFVKLLIEGGFSPDNIQVIYEPFKIHGIGICKK